MLPYLIALDDVIDLPQVVAATCFVADLQQHQAYFLLSQFSHSNSALPASLKHTERGTEMGRGGDRREKQRKAQRERQKKSRGRKNGRKENKMTMIASERDVLVCVSFLSSVLWYSLLLVKIWSTFLV